MLIDWVTVGAQIINFLILVYLLKRFLYGRVLQVMDERQKKLTAEFSAAKTAQTEAEEERHEFKKKNDELTKQREELLNQIQQEAEKEKQILLKDARTEVEEQRTRWAASLQQEKKEFITQLRDRTTREIIQISGKALQSLGNLSLEQAVADVFVQRIEFIREEVWDTLRSSVRIEDGNEEEHAFTIQSSFEQPADQQEKIRTLLQQKIGREIPIHFEVLPKSSWGIELRIGGNRIAWTLDDYLEELQEKVTSEFDHDIRWIST